MNYSGWTKAKKFLYRKGTVVSMNLKIVNRFVDLSYAVEWFPYPASYVICLWLQQVFGVNFLCVISTMVVLERFRHRDMSVYDFLSNFEIKASGSNI